MHIAGHTVDKNFTIPTFILKNAICTKLFPYGTAYQVHFKIEILLVYFKI